jgi:hypothetical protein
VTGLQFASFARVCRERDCQLEAEPRKQRCYECWLAAQAPVIRTLAAERRASLIPEPYRISTVPKGEWPEGRRWCSGCQSFVRLKDCTGSRCSACVSIASHKHRIKATFGLDPETYQWLLKLQHGKCAICRQAPKTVRMAIDHDHNHCKQGCSQCARGLLCSRCNHELLGAAHDSVNILRNAVAYMERPPMSGEWDIPEYEKDEWEKTYGDREVAPF